VDRGGLTDNNDGGGAKRSRVRGSHGGGGGGFTTKGALPLPVVPIGRLATVGAASSPNAYP